VSRIALGLTLALVSCAHAPAANKKPEPPKPSAQQTQVPEQNAVLVEDGQRIPIDGKTSFLLADVESAQKLISRRDGFVAGMSALDRKARLNRSTDVSEEELLEHFKAQVRPFNEVHAQRMRKAAKAIGEALSREHIALDLPGDVVVVLTSGLEEAGAQVGVAYTREGVIYLNERALEESPTYLLSHELFHVYGHYHPDTREQLYAAIGFMPLGKRIVWPEPIEARRVSSPDSPYAEHAIRVRYQGKEMLAVYVCLADGQDVTGPNLFEQVATYYALLDPNEKRADKASTRMELANYHSFENFFEQVGYNTGYLAGPEEILADNFELLLEHPERARTPELLTRLRQAMARR
jgi:hypothetical protein